jgi:uncharacterized protein YoxC
MQEKINFEFKTNLDQIAKSVKKLSNNVDVLSKSFSKKNILLEKQNKLEEKNSNTINKLGSEYGQLNEKLDSFIKKGKDVISRNLNLIQTKRLFANEDVMDIFIMNLMLPE